MAPPTSRRSGHSRRAQYSIFTGYVVASIGALIGAALLAISFFQPSAFSGLRGAAANTVEPAAEVTTTGRNGISGLYDNISGYLRAGSQNAALNEELAIARIKLAEAEAVEQENQRLKALLGVKDTEVEPVVVSRLVGSTSASTRRFAYLGAGSNQGVEPGMPVRGPHGVVGRILEVSGNSARVMLLTDSESVLPVRSASDDVIAFAEGRGDGLLSIRLINLGINPLEPGDVFVTSGSGGYYRPGVAVAIVEEVTSDGAIARLVADPAASDVVSVEPIWQPEGLDGAQTPVEEELTDGQSVPASVATSGPEIGQ
ncbi:MAG: rod shape-determining protein MreC [Erythrobacter sp.]